MWIPALRPSHQSRSQRTGPGPQGSNDFLAINTDLLGLSIDSHFSHIAWTRTIEEEFGVDIPFLIIADPSIHVYRRQKDVVKRRITG